MRSRAVRWLVALAVGLLPMVGTAQVPTKLLRVGVLWVDRPGANFEAFLADQVIE